MTLNFYLPSFCFSGRLTTTPANNFNCEVRLQEEKIYFLTLENINIIIEMSKN